MIKEKTVIIKWGVTNKDYFEKLGYKFEKYLSEFEAKIEHLSKCSTAKITAICDKCKLERIVQYRSYRILCKSCSRGGNGINKEKKTEKKIVVRENGTFNILENYVKTRWNSSNIKHYKSLGYIFTKKLDELEVKIFELPINSSVKITAICVNCGEHRIIEFSDYTDFCHKCSIKNRENNNLEYKKNRSEHMKKLGKMVTSGEFKPGKLHRNWDFSKTDEDRKINRNFIPENKIWSKNIKMRDNYICQICFKKGERLVSHHLMSYNIYPELRLDLDNGICLCRNCHLQFHKIFGNGWNTAFQFNEYKFYKSLELNNINYIAPVLSKLKV